MHHIFIRIEHTCYFCVFLLTGWRIHRPMSRRERVIVNLFPHPTRSEATGFDERDATQVECGVSRRAIGFLCVRVCM